MRRIGLFLGPFICFGGVAILMFSLFSSSIVGFDLFPILFMATIPDWMGGSPIPIANLITLYFIQTSASSQRTTLLLSIGIILIIIGIASLIVGFKAAAEAEEIGGTLKPVIKETIKEREIIYIRCSHCGYKVLETEKKCPNCGAKL